MSLTVLDLPPRSRKRLSVPEKPRLNKRPERSTLDLPPLFVDCNCACALALAVRFRAVQADIEPVAFSPVRRAQRGDETDQLQEHETADAAVDGDPRESLRPESAAAPDFRNSAPSWIPLRLFWRRAGEQRADRPPDPVRGDDVERVVERRLDRGS